MEVIIITAIIAIIIVIILMPINIKKMNKIATDKELNEISKKYPDNTEICKEILLKLENKRTKIEENKDSESTLYVALQDKIYIGNTHGSFTRIQTIAHECLHSIQDRKLLMFNFIFSNIYIAYFIIICALEIFNILPNSMIFLTILILFGFTQYIVRAYLENDAMIKARYLAKEYMNNKKISDGQEVEKIVKGFDNINDIGIKCVNYNLFLSVMVKALIFSIICIFI